MDFRVQILFLSCSIVLATNFAAAGQDIEVEKSEMSLNNVSHASYLGIGDPGVQLAASTNTENGDMQIKVASFAANLRFCSLTKGYSEKYYFELPLLNCRLFVLFVLVVSTSTT